MIYKMQIPPFPVKSFDLLTTRQAKEIHITKKQCSGRKIISMVTVGDDI